MASVITSVEAGSNGSAAGAADGATLAGRTGVGSLRVWRGQHGQVLGYAGSWRRALGGANGEAGIDELRRALEDGRALRFQGPLDDTARADPGAVDVEVRISSIGTYRYLLDPEDPGSAAVEVTLVNFRPVEDALVG